MGRKPSEKATPDTLWFKGAFADAGLSQREAALRLGVDHAALSKMVRGERAFPVVLVQRMAAVLNKQVEEIVSHIGGRATKAEKLSRGATARVTVPAKRHVAGIVDVATGVVTFPGPLPKGDTFALTIQGDDFLAGRVLLAHSDVVSPRAADSGTGILQLDDGRTIVGAFKPGFAKGRYDVGPVLGFGDRHNDVAILGLYELIGVDMEKV